MHETATFGAHADDDHMRERSATVFYFLSFRFSLFPALSLSSFLKLLKRHNISTNMTQTHQGLNISRLNHAVCWGSVFIIFFLLALSYYVKFKLSSLRYFIHKVEYKRCSTHWQTSYKTGGRTKILFARVVRLAIHHTHKLNSSQNTFPRIIDDA